MEKVEVVSFVSVSRSTLLNLLARVCRSPDSILGLSDPPPRSPFVFGVAALLDRALFILKKKVSSFPKLGPSPPPSGLFVFILDPTFLRELH